jgi:hypothetical protein
LIHALYLLFIAIQVLLVPPEGAFYVPVRLAAFPDLVGYAALHDLLGPALSATSLSVGMTIKAIVTQLPVPPGPFSESMPPFERSTAAVKGLLLLSAAPAVVALGAAPTALGDASRRSGGSGGASGRGVSVSELQPGMSVTAMLRAHGGDLGSSATRAIGGRLPPLHVTLVGVHGRYDARLSAAECVELCPYAAPPGAGDASVGTDAAGRAALAKYFELLDSPAGTLITAKIAVVARESRAVRGPGASARQRSGGAATAGGEDNSPDEAVMEVVHRIELTCRPSDLALPDLHLASCRPDWSDVTQDSNGGDQDGNVSMRIVPTTTVIATSAATLAAAPPSDCTLAATRDGGAKSSLVAGATGVGVVLGVSAAEGQLWLGIGGGVYARVALVDCGASSDVRDAATGELVVSPAVATALSGSKVLELHPIGSLVSFVLLHVARRERRATASIRLAARALEVGRLLRVSADSTVTLKDSSLKGRQKKKLRGMDSGAQQSGELRGASFDEVVASVQHWLADAAAACVAPGRVALAQVRSCVVSEASCFNEEPFHFFLPCLLFMLDCLTPCRSCTRLPHERPPKEEGEGPLLCACSSAAACSRRRTLRSLLTVLSGRTIRQQRSD